MTPAQIKKLEHLQWAIKSRADNQRSAVRLLHLFWEYEGQWKTLRWSRAAQDLLSVSFSLWRAAFLADKTGQRVEVFSDATIFLEKIIEDNAISYLNDRNCKEWTFNYYTRNARAALENLHKFWPDQLPAYEGGKQTPTERWRYCQKLLDTAVENFQAAAEDIRTQNRSTKQAKEIRMAAKARRRKSREITLAARKHISPDEAEFGR
jgi:hypothetical protein